MALKLMRISKIKISPSIRRRVMRVIAIFFLLYTGADITLPQYFCGSNSDAFQKVALTSSERNDGNEALGASTLAIKTPDNSQPDQDKELPHQEDCFCCCIHVLPENGLQPAVLAQISTTNILAERKFVPMPPAFGFFRPPRQA